MKRVFSSFNQTAAYHARNLLEAEGIEVLVRNAMLSSAMGELPPAECQMELWVLDDADATAGPRNPEQKHLRTRLDLRMRREARTAVHAMLALRRLPARELTVVQAR